MSFEEIIASRSGDEVERKPRHARKRKMVTRVAQHTSGPGTRVGLAVTFQRPFLLRILLWRTVISIARKRAS
jgi:hypothetical protein